ncbi:MAG: Fe-S cluster assembly protein SufD, partial [Pseudomonadota bacterium]
MNIAVAKTEAEKTLGERFEASVASLPGGDDVATLRKNAFGVFAALGLPSRRVEEWKYTDLRARMPT